MKEILGALARRDGEVGPRGVADEERVPCEHELAVDDERAVLGTMAGCVQDADRDGTDLDHVAVGKRLVRKLRLCERMDRDG